MTNSSLQIELPFYPKNIDSFYQLLKAKKIENLTLGEHRNVTYCDSFWDTATGDLHASSRTLRTRSREGGPIDFLDYKAPPRYETNNLFARKLVSERIVNDGDALSAIRLQRHSEPIKQLFTDRPDLIGSPLFEVAKCLVERTNFDIHHEKKPPILTISAHKYRYLINSKETEDFFLIEVQPKGTQPINESLLSLLAAITTALKTKNWKFSPTSKYLRIPRSSIDIALEEKAM